MVRGQRSELRQFLDPFSWPWKTPSTFSVPLCPINYRPLPTKGESA